MVIVYTSVHMSCVHYIEVNLPITIVSLDVSVVDLHLSANLRTYVYLCHNCVDANVKRCMSTLNVSTHVSKQVGKC